MQLEALIAALCDPSLEAAVAAEFTELKAVDAAFTTDDFRVGNSPLNKSRNRYYDIIANDATLYPPVDSGLPYVNANLIRGTIFGAEESFVAHQAPLPSQAGDFWQVVHCSGARLVVMLTQEVERGARKADRYWPTAAASVRFGNSDTVAGGRRSGEAVFLSETRVPGLDDVLFTDVSLRGDDSSSRTVRLIRYEGWPDFGVPANPSAFLRLLEYVDAAIDASAPAVPAGVGARGAIVDSSAAARTRPPIFIHCSAGVGRTGTLIAAHYAFFLLRRGLLHRGTIFEIVRHLKQQRAGMVQRKEQLHFIYTCVLAEARRLFALSRTTSPTAPIGDAA